jgi:hypothetical protein
VISVIANNHIREAEKLLQDARHELLSFHDRMLDDARLHLEIARMIIMNGP